MEKFRKPIGIAAFTTIAVLGISFILDNVYEDDVFSLETLEKVSSLITGLALFGIALALHRKFDSNQSIKDKQTQSVLELVDLLQSIVIKIEFNSEVGGNTVHNETTLQVIRQFDRRPIIDQLRKSHDQDVIDGNQFYRPSVIELYETLISMAGNTYIPKSIADKIIKEFDIKSMFSIEGGTSPVGSDDSVVSVIRNIRSNVNYYDQLISQNESEYSDKYIHKYNNKSVNVDDLANDIKNIYQLAYDWLKLNSAEVLSELNIEILDVKKK